MNGSQFYVTTGESLVSLDEKVGGAPSGWAGREPRHVGGWSSGRARLSGGATGRRRLQQRAPARRAATRPAAPPPAASCITPHATFGEVAEGLDMPLALEAITF